MLVQIKLRFNTHCLANKKMPNGSFIFERTPDERIFFHASRLMNNLVVAARIIGNYQHLVSQIRWDLELIDAAPLSKHLRYVRPRCYAVHESIPAGGIAVLEAVLPEGLNAEAFSELMATAGRFCGLSPFGANQGFGKYTVLFVQEKKPKTKKPVASSQDTTDSFIKT